jgi:hypothetical protein
VGEWRAERNKRHGRCREHGRQRDQGHADRNPLRAAPPCRDTFGIHVYAVHEIYTYPEHSPVWLSDINGIIIKLLSHKFSNRNGDIETCPERMEEESKVE